VLLRPCAVDKYPLWFGWENRNVIINVIILVMNVLLMIIDTAIVAFSDYLLGGVCITLQPWFVDN